MPEAFSLGPFLVPTRGMGFILLAILAMWLIHRLAVYLGAAVNPTVRIAEQSLWLGFIAARLAYVLQHWSSFSAKPLAALYFWLPGYNFGFGVLMALAYVLFRVYRQAPAARKSMLASLFGGVALPAVLYAGLILSMNRFVDEAVLIPGDSLLALQVSSLDGQQAAFADYAGKAIVLNFWATWCPPCRREMPLLQSTYQHYKAQAQKVVIIGVAMDDSIDSIQQYIQTAGVTYPIWTNQLLVSGPQATGSIAKASSLSALFNVKGFPTTFFIYPDGRIHSSYVGELNQAILDERIGLLMDQDR